MAEARRGDEGIGIKPRRGEGGSIGGVRDFVLAVNDHSIFQFYSNVNCIVCVDDGED